MKMINDINLIMKWFLNIGCIFDFCMCFLKVFMDFVYFVIIIGMFVLYYYVGIWSWVIYVVLFWIFEYIIFLGGRNWNNNGGWDYLLLRFLFFCLLILVICNNFLKWCLFWVRIFDRFVCGIICIIRWYFWG